MTFDIFKRDLLHVAFGIVVTALFFIFLWPRFHHAGPACHDEVYVLAPFEDDDGGHDGLPPRRTKFACPHPDQKLEVIGHGGLTCKCDAYLRSR